MKDLIRKILKESEDDLEWARDIINMPPIPKPDGNRYLILFNNGISIPEVENLVELLYSLGWKFKIHSNQHTYPTISQHSNKKEGYIHLRPEGLMTYGSSKNGFTNVNGVNWDDVPKIYWSTK